MRYAVVTLVVGFLGLFGTSCGKDTTVQPTPAPPSSPLPPSSPPPPPISATASLTISGLKLTLTPGYTVQQTGYEARFLLTETSRKSGATIKRVETFNDRNNSSIVGDSCWRDTIRVEAGQTIDTFDAGWKKLSYCAPTTDNQPTSHVRLVVTFVDDDGHTGTASASAAVPD